MGQKKRTRHTANFKVKVVLESYNKGNIAEVARNYGISSNQLSNWRKTFKENAYLAFEKNPEKVTKEHKKKIEQLENLVGKKEVEINLLKKYLDFYAPVNCN